LLAAHFFREQSYVLVALCLAAIGLMAWRSPWAHRIVQAALVLGALQWLWTTAMLVQERMQEGRPWIRLAAILGAVAAFTALSALALERLRGWYAGKPRA
jgi:uncharacterized membrane protein HdeD (DUF308 family)